MVIIGRQNKITFNLYFELTNGRELKIFKKKKKKAFGRIKLQHYFTAYGEDREWDGLEVRTSIRLFYIVLLSSAERKC